MACDTQYTRPNQTLTERKKEIAETVAELAKQLAAGTVKPVVGPQGAVAFQGWQNRAGITDACAYRRVMATGNPRRSRLGSGSSVAPLRWPICTAPLPTIPRPRRTDTMPRRSGRFCSRDHSAASRPDSGPPHNQPRRADNADDAY